jgi:hypothetical protein
MSLRPDPTAPADMTADERMDELASIFARGILRLHERPQANIPAPQNLEDSSPTCLELSAPPCRDGVAG